MAEHQHIDLTTLREVERLLATTEFVSADELLARGVIDLSPAPSPTTASANAGAPTGTGAPLPRRR